MKLNVHFTELWKNVNNMGAEVVDFTLTSNLEAFDHTIFEKELSSKKGLEVSLEEIEIKNNLLSFNGKQIILFIPDQGAAISSVISGSRSGKKFHVSDCKTINDMKRSNRFERYRVTTNLTGWFHVFGKTQFGTHKEGEAKLQVCKNCLDNLNYKQCRRNTSIRNQIVKNFSIEVFLQTYSTFFKATPEEKNPNNISGYVDNWKDLSFEYRKKQNFTCEKCSVSLRDHQYLLDAHHINGVKTDNSDKNLMALCKICHSQEPKHEHMFVSTSQKTKIEAIRKLQAD